MIALLKKRPNSRRAVIQLFDAEDIDGDHQEIPCTTTLQFISRDSKLDAIVTMRSNDAFMGLPHDVFCFTMLQEMIASSLNLDLGSYKHFVGSMHFYEEDYAKAEAFIGEGFQARIEMPAMPKGAPWEAISIILKAEADVRAGRAVAHLQAALALPLPLTSPGLAPLTVINPNLPN